MPQLRSRRAPEDLLPGTSCEMQLLRLFRTFCSGVSEKGCRRAKEGILGLRIVSLDVPQRVSVGREALLKCAYDLEGDLLYSVKWYKDDIEFFRYVPSDRPPGQYFEVNGIRVDGTYKCEVSADAPSFQTIFAEKMIRVDSGSSSQLRTSGVAWALVATIGCLTSLLRWHAT
ncbi:hypothetical protein MRX96_036802 [Rhipicephalus microplus]